MRPYVTTVQKKGIRADCRAGGGGRPGVGACEGCHPHRLEDDAEEMRHDYLTEDQKVILQEKAYDHITEASDAMEEFFGASGDVELMEACCPPDSRLVQTFLNKGRSAMRIGLPAFDVSKRKGKEEVMRMARKHRPGILWISLAMWPLLSHPGAFQ